MSTMTSTKLRTEMIGDWELSLIEFIFPGDPPVRAFDFKARFRQPNGVMTREVGDSSRRFSSQAEAWEAGKAFVASR